MDVCPLTTDTPFTRMEALLSIAVGVMAMAASVTDDEYVSVDGLNTGVIMPPLMVRPLRSELVPAASYTSNSMHAASCLLQFNPEVTYNRT